MKKLIFLLLLGSCKSGDVTPSVCYECTYIREVSYLDSNWKPSFTEGTFLECDVNYGSIIEKYNYSQSGERTRISQKTNCIKK